MFRLFDLGYLWIFDSRIRCPCAISTSHWTPPQTASPTSSPTHPNPNPSQPNPNPTPQTPTHPTEKAYQTTFISPKLTQRQFRFKSHSTYPNSHTEVFLVLNRPSLLCELRSMNINGTIGRFCEHCCFVFDWICHRPWSGYEHIAYIWSPQIAKAMASANSSKTINSSPASIDQRLSPNGWCFVTHA